VATIKAQIMASLKQTLAALPEIRKVEYTKFWPLFSDTMPSPSIYFFTGAAKSTRLNERTVRVSVNLIIGVYVALGPKGPVAFEEKADSLLAAIEDAVCGMVRPDLAGAYFHTMDPWTWDQHIPNDIWGVLGLDAHLTFHHAWGNASVKPF